MFRPLMVLYAVPVFAMVALSAMQVETVTLKLYGIAACVVCLAFSYAIGRLGRATGRRLWPVLFAAGVCIALVLSVMATHWPLRITYALSRPAMERLAARVLAGQPPTRPERVGLITVEKAGLSRHGLICLWTETDPTGYTGFIRCRTDELPKNLWSSVELDERWHFVQED